MHKIEFIENIPQIPEELLTYNIEEIATMKNQFGDSKVQSYSTHNVYPHFLNLSYTIP